MDYRVEFSRQNLRREAQVFQEVDFRGGHDPSHLHRKLSRQLTQLGYQIVEENLSIARRPIGDGIGDVLGVLHGVVTTPIPNAGVITYGLMNRQHVRSVSCESHLRVAMTGEYYPQERHLNLSVMVAGRLSMYEDAPDKIWRSKKAEWMHPQAQETISALMNKLAQDVMAVVAFTRAQVSVASEYDTSVQMKPLGGQTS